MEYYSTVKMNEIMPFSSWQMDLEIIILSQAEKDKHYMIWHSLYDMGMIQMDYLQSRNRLSDTENKHIVTKKEMGEG